jgi:hypothetical protein
MSNGGAGETWVLLAYRMPREPSTPRSAVWRRLKRLGVAQLVDGLVALPADARTQEQLEWVAEAVIEAGGEAGVWTGQPLEAATQQRLAAQIRAAAAVDYAVVTTEARQVGHADPADHRRVLARLRRELYRIGQRDYFPPPERETARAAVADLAALAAAPLTTQPSP